MNAHTYGIKIEIEMVGITEVEINQTRKVFVLLGNSSLKRA